MHKAIVTRNGQTRRCGRGLFNVRIITVVDMPFEGTCDTARPLSAKKARFDGRAASVASGQIVINRRNSLDAASG
jgi:hypothetical protein